MKHRPAASRTLPHRSVRLSGLAGAFALALALAGCAVPYPGATATDTQDGESIQQKLAGDLPLPRNAVIDQKESLILGGGNNWTGRIALNVGGDVKELFTFFRDQLSNAGWQTVATVLSKNSILTFIKGERSATIELSDGALGNRVVITVGGIARKAAPANTGASASASGTPAAKP
ncbi:MAG: hypothetical protein MO847_12090 [Candidatus Protistobacter heckmanni]|nr:hypothetical protein [Candidatus Protistobacter heckmanni]